MDLVSAYLPCYNNEDTILRAVQSVQQQSVAVAEIFVVDDGSTDASAARVEAAGVKLIRNLYNAGRGAVRAKAVSEASHDLLVSCDATIALAPDFVERALRWMSDENVAGVQGRILQEAPSTLADRWRGRHLFRVDAPLKLSRNALHMTTASLIRRSAALRVGNYRSDLGAGEDKDLGSRLLQAGCEVIFDPDLTATSLTSDENICQVFERYWRWNEGLDNSSNWEAYARQIVYATKVMAVQDLKAGDPLSVPFSLLSPHYQFWRSWWQKACNRRL